MSGKNIWNFFHGKALCVKKKKVYATSYKITKIYGMQCTAQEMQSIFSTNNFKWSVISKNFQSLWYIPETNIKL